MEQKNLENNNASEKPIVVGVSPKTVKIYGLSLTGFLVPFFGIVPSIAALAQSRKAKREILQSEGSLTGLDLYKKSLVFAWLGVVSFLINTALIGLLIWLITIIPNLINSPEFRDMVSDNVSSVVSDVPVDLDLEGLGFTDSEIRQFEDALPEGVTLDNLTLDDIIKLAEEYGIN